jgi:proteasome assembly chaperone (PAC2) family protein
VKPQVRIYNRPDLRNPYLIIGWADAGLIGTTAINYLTDKLGAEEFGEIDLHDFSLMPYIFIKDGVIQELEYPDSSLYYWKNKNLDRDLIIWGGKPPTINHYQLANAILDVAKLFSVSRIYTMGGLYANVTHTEKPRVFAIINKSILKRYLSLYDIESGTDYHGTPSMNGLVLGLAQQRNIEGISLWGQVPSYIGDIANPQVCEAVLSTLTTMLDIDIDFTEIRAEADYTTKQINELVTYLRQQDNELDQHIDKLEKGIDVHLSEEDSHRFFREIEEFLRKQQGRKEGD